MFKAEEIAKAKELSYKNWENEDGIGFEFKGMWITNPFLEETGRFEFASFEVMCMHYGTENVVAFIKEILK